MRRLLVVGNWKMHKTPDEAVKLARALMALVGGTGGDRDLVVCPPFVDLQSVGPVLRNTPIALGAQNVHWEMEGAYTGEVSPSMILTCGCTYVILGHSERRQHFGETEATVNRKLIAALEVGLLPIVCVGESLEQREAGCVEEVVLGQLESALCSVAQKEIPRVAVAYEPVWAIGTGRTASSEQAEEVHDLIRRFVHRHYGDGAAARIRILYGGSVKPENAADLFARANIDGVLVGGASLQAETFAAIAKTGG